jgi:hypothetical protein
VGVRTGVEARIIAGIVDRGGDIFRLRFGRVGDSSGVVGVDLRKGAQKQAANVGENSGAARRDAVLGQELVEVAEGIVDSLGCLKALGIPDEGSVQISTFHLFLLGMVLGTKAGVSVSDDKTALTPPDSAMGATG